MKVWKIVVNFEMAGIVLACVPLTRFKNQQVYAFWKELLETNNKDLLFRLP